MSVQLQVLRLDRGVPLPSYAHPGDAGADLAISEDVVILPGQRVLVGTGIAVVIPDGYVGLVHPRSGLAARHGLTIVNAPGTIDSGYRGEIRVNLLNTDVGQPVSLRRGDLVAQLVIQPVARAEVVEVDELPPSQRGQSGHGSSGGIAGWRTVGADTDEEEDIT
ncbi:MAG: dUTP diphosphatase [Actinomycetia bacterium]|nr:dUTP diphosphatase [Actinomycetes bacterium]